MKTVDYFIEELKYKKSFILAIDGMCAAGKSTLAQRLEKELDCLVFHMDDFYLPIEKRTQERLSQPGGNVDYERFEATVLKPLSLQQDIFYQPFNCSQMKLSQAIQISYHPRIIIEGSYSLRPELVKYYSDQVALQVSTDLQIKRLKERNPHKLNDFITKWIPLENQYFEYFHIFEQYPTIFIAE